MQVNVQTWSYLRGIPRVPAPSCSEGAAQTERMSSTSSVRETLRVTVDHGGAGGVGGARGVGGALSVGA